jgi:hypothetical protein
MRLWPLIAVALAAATLTAACGTASEPMTSSSLPAGSTSLSSRSESRALSTLLWRLEHTALAWRYEPKGDAPGDAGTASGTLVFALVHSVNRHGPTVSFDAVQYFSGAPAEKEYIRTHPEAKGLPVGGRYMPNRYVHLQTLPYAKDCIVAEGYGEARLVPARKVSFPNSDGGYFWLVVEGGKVTAMVWQPTNE